MCLKVKKLLYEWDVLYILMKLEYFFNPSIMIHISINCMV
jgi:hypothetical protein